MGRAFSIHGREEECIENFDEKVRKREREHDEDLDIRVCGGRKVLSRV
jgi:hypothetical protein